MDIIEIKTIKLNALIGVYAWEKKIPQKLEIDIAYGLSSADHSADKLSNTIDYDEIINHIEQFVQTHQFQLLETLGQSLIESIFAVFDTPWIKLSICKPYANLKAKAITLTLTRSKENET